MLRCYGVVVVVVVYQVLSPIFNKNGDVFVVIVFFCLNVLEKSFRFLCVAQESEMCSFFLVKLGRKQSIHFVLGVYSIGRAEIKSL